MRRDDNTLRPPARHGLRVHHVEKRNDDRRNDGVTKRKRRTKRSRREDQVEAETDRREYMRGQREGGKMPKGVMMRTKVNPTGRKTPTYRKHKTNAGLAPDSKKQRRGDNK